MTTREYGKLILGKNINIFAIYYINEQTAVQTLPPAFSCKNCSINKHRAKSSQILTRYLKISLLLRKQHRPIIYTPGMIYYLSIKRRKTREQVKYRQPTDPRATPRMLRHQLNCHNRTGHNKTSLKRV